MKIRVERLVSDKVLGTTGVISIDGTWAGFTCEDEYREEKVSGETRIPAGAYEIKLRTAGGMHKRYTEKFGERHHGMLWLQDVPGFEWIYIHPGNTPAHSHGCILVGYGAMHVPDTTPKVLSSTECYHAISAAVHGALERGETVSIEIIDKDR